MQKIVPPLTRVLFSFFIFAALHADAAPKIAPTHALLHSVKLTFAKQSPAIVLGPHDLRKPGRKVRLPEMAARMTVLVRMAEHVTFVPVVETRFRTGMLVGNDNEKVILHDWKSAPSGWTELRLTKPADQTTSIREYGFEFPDQWKQARDHAAKEALDIAALQAEIKNRFSGKKGETLAAAIKNCSSPVSGACDTIVTAVEVRIGANMRELATFKVIEPAG